MHCQVRIVGWGQHPPHWVVANTWGRSWGEEGLLRIRRGDNTARCRQIVNNMFNCFTNLLPNIFVAQDRGDGDGRVAGWSVAQKTPAEAWQGAGQEAGTLRQGARRWMEVVKK